MATAEESGSMLPPPPPPPPPVPPATDESQESVSAVNYEEDMSMEVLDASEGTLIIVLLVVGAILLICDTRSTRGTGGNTILDDGEGKCTAKYNKPQGKWSERVVPKILQVAYCVMAGTGERRMSLGLHKRLSAYIKYQFKANKRKLLSREVMNEIERIVPDIPHPDGKVRTPKFKVVIPMWDNELGELPVPRILTLDAAVGKAVDHRRDGFCCLGDQDHIARNIITSKLDSIKNEKRRLTYNEGRELLNEAMDAAAIKSSGRIGGRKKLCVIQPRDKEEMDELLGSNLSKRLLHLDRSVTFMDLGELPESRPPATSSSTSSSSGRNLSGVEGRVAGRKAGEESSSSGVGRIKTREELSSSGVKRRKKNPTG